MAPKTKAQYDEIRRQSMQAIKEVALELFAENGFHNTSISQIARKAGVSKGLMYNYFESKEALLMAIIEEVVAGGEKMMGDMFEQTDDPYQQLAAIVEGSFRMVRSDPHHWKLLTSLALQPDIVSQVEPLVQYKTKMALGQMEALFRKLGYPEPRQESYLFGAQLDGIMLHYLSVPDYPVEAMKAYLLKKYQKQ